MEKGKHVCVGNLLRSRLQCVENCYISHFSSCEKLGKYQFGKNADKKFQVDSINYLHGRESKYKNVVLQYQDIVHKYRINFFVLFLLSLNKCQFCVQQEKRKCQMVTFFSLPRFFSLNVFDHDNVLQKSHHLLHTKLSFVIPI